LFRKKGAVGVLFYMPFLLSHLSVGFSSYEIPFANLVFIVAADFLFGGSAVYSGDF